MLAADESFHDRSTLDVVDGLYDVVNIKLDKTGGLTEAIATRDAARDRGLGIMIGCMVSTSLAIAPAMMLCEGAVAVDLDGPILLEQDRRPGLVYDGSAIEAPEPRVWG